MTFRSVLLSAACLTPFGTASAQASPQVANDTAIVVPSTPLAASAPPRPSEPSTNASAADIVVTAQRRSERIQDVPISISAISGNMIGGGKTTTIADFAGKVPGLQFNQVFQSSNPTIFLRGVGVNDYNASSSGAVGVSIDDVFMNSGVGQLAGMFDVDRVEVLKGPQGTLFGRNTTGGILNIYTKRPTFDTKADVSLSYGRFDQLFLDGGLGGTLINDLVAYRVSGTYHRRDGWMLNEYDGQYGNDIDNLGGRVQLLVTPASNFTIDLKVEGSRSRTSAIRGKSGGTYNSTAGRNCTGAEILTLNICSNPLSGYVDNDSLNKTSTQVTDNYERLDSFGTRVAMNWDLGGVNVTAITAYTSNKRELNQDQDMSPASLLETPLWTDKSKQFSQEIRLGSSDPGRLTWVAGAFFLRDKLTEAADFNLLNSFNPNPDQPYFDPANFIMTIGRRYRQVTTSKALFAQADYEILPKVTLTAGIRYTWDKKDLDFITYAGAVGGANRYLTSPIFGLLDSDTVSPTVDAPIRTNNEYNKPTWRLALNWKATPDMLLYASYNRGFRSGGHNTGALFSSVEFTQVKPEKIDAFEAGFKSDLFGRTLRLNGAAFYYQYDDMQVFTLQSVPGVLIPFQRLQNANARIYGAELEATLRVANGLTVHGAASYLNTEYTQLLDPINGDLSGNTLEKSPRWQLIGDVNYTRPLTQNVDWHIAGDITYSTQQYLSPLNREPLKRNGNAIMNAELGLVDKDSGLSATVWAKNIAGKRYLVDAIDVSSFGNYALFYNPPRTFGMTLSYRH